MTYRFTWNVLWSGQTGGWLLQGVITTLEISAIAWLLAVALGLLSGALRTAPVLLLRCVGAASERLVLIPNKRLGLLQ